MPRVQRKWEIFPGKNTFYCDGRIVMGRQVSFQRFRQHHHYHHYHRHYLNYSRRASSMSPSSSSSAPQASSLPLTAPSSQVGSDTNTNTNTYTNTNTNTNTNPFPTERISPVIPVVGAVLFIFVLSNLLKTSFSDPGIIPRATNAEAENIEREIEQPNGAGQAYRPPPRTKEIQVVERFLK